MKPDATNSLFPPLAAHAAVRIPRADEVPAIAALIAGEAEVGSVLPRSEEEILSNREWFVVYVDDDGVGACCALHPDTDMLAEIRSIIVHDRLRGRGIGSRLARHCVELARERGLARVYALTRAQHFFSKLGFYETSMSALPSKVFRDCVRCPMYPHCDEVAMMYDVRTAEA